MFLDDVLSSGSIPVLEATLRFAAQRHQILTHNIANLSTPDFRPMDVSPQGFERAMDKAIRARREETGGMTGSLPIESTREIRATPDGQLVLKPLTASGNILFHDRSNSDLERLEQDSAENALVYKATGELLRSRYAALRDAIAERV